MIKSISLWSFPDKLNLEQCFVLAKKLGYPAVEMTCDLKGRFTVGASEEDCENVRRLAHKVGIQLSSLASSNCRRGCSRSGRRRRAFTASGRPGTRSR